jgi:SAM-dependent methyltransferase
LSLNNPRIQQFDKYYRQYDDWFVINKDIYQAELNAIKNFIPKNKKGVEIGVGSARFALPLKIKIGVEPSKKMAEISRNRGIQVFRSVAEKLPFENDTFDFVLIVTTICFVDDPMKCLQESFRILRDDGFIIIGFIDKERELGNKYQFKKNKSNFYKTATFYSVKEILAFLHKANFKNFSIKQTAFSCEANKMESMKNGYGEGSFVVIKAEKSTNVNVDKNGK